METSSVLLNYNSESRPSVIVFGGKSKNKIPIKLLNDDSETNLVLKKFGNVYDDKTVYSKKYNDENLLRVLPSISLVGLWN